MADTYKVEELRENAKADQEHLVTRLQDELDRMIKMFAHAREAVNNEMMDGLGYKKMGLSEKDMKKLVSLADLAASVVATKIRFDKALKDMANRMTPAEEKAAVIAYIKSCEAQDRGEIIRTIKDWEAKRYERGNSNPAG